MKRVMVFLFPVVLAVLMGSAFVYAFFPEQDEDVRGAFLTSRPSAGSKTSTNRPGRAMRRRPRPAATPEPTPIPTKSPKTTPHKTPTPKVEPSTTHKPRAQKIGIGLTLFMRDSNGLSVRVDPAREFKKDDRVRLLLESNVDGFLYVFNTTDNGPPVLIYPDPDLDEGGNFIQAHVPVEVPSSLATEERLKWFRFDENPGVERLYFVFTREPLAGIPLEDDLISFCRENNKNCPMRPAADLWAEVQKQSGVPIQSNKAGSFGGAETSGEHQASTRGIGLNKSDPEPSLVMMTASSETSRLVALLDLVHK